MTVNTVYILMREFGKTDLENNIYSTYVPYAVFNDKSIAERMKMNNDYIVEAPYIYNPQTSSPVKISDSTWSYELRPV